jgi:putative two-component system response regulator
MGDAMEAPENRRILIVDDNESIHADFRKILGAADALSAAVDSAAAALFDDRQAPRPQAGFEIDSAYQGEEGLTLAQERAEEGRPYALAFVDVRMPPGWNGVETVRRLWQVDGRLQVVLCTAYSDYSWNDIIEQIGENDGLLILKKPFDNIEVRQLAWALVAKWNLAQKANRTLRDLRETVNRQTRALRSAHDETVYRLVRASLCRDEETGSHIRRTGLSSELLAAAAGWGSARIEQLRLAAPMHDVGKIGIPDAILRKQGQLTPEETAIMQAHTTLGATMLAGSESPFFQMAHDIALYHHEHWDGSGYPAGLAGEAIPEAARIVAIVDVYDALTHDRVYRRELPEDEVVKIMLAGRGTHFDPRLLDIFMSQLPEMRAIAQAAPDEEETASFEAARAVVLKSFLSQSAAEEDATSGVSPD